MMDALEPLMEAALVAAMNMNSDSETTILI
jgi:hypothetical protein